MLALTLNPRKSISFFDESGKTIAQVYNREDYQIKLGFEADEKIQILRDEIIDKYLNKEGEE